MSPREFVGYICRKFNKKNSRTPARRSVFRYVALKASVYACSKLSFVNKGMKCSMEGNENIRCKFLISKARALLLTRRSGTPHRAALIAKLSKRALVFVYSVGKNELTQK